MFALAVVELFEIVLAVAIGVFLLSQIVYPIFSGKPFFWMFKKSEKRLTKKEEELADLGTEEKVVELQGQVKKKKDMINKKMTGGGEGRGESFEDAQQ